MATEVSLLQKKAGGGASFSHPEGGGGEGGHKMLWGSFNMGA